MPNIEYQNLLAALEQELTYTFGGCTTIRGIDGHYLSRAGVPIRDRIHLVYSDAPYSLDRQLDRIAAYADAVRSAADQALSEEAILVAVHAVHHAE